MLLEKLELEKYRKIVLEMSTIEDDIMQDIQHEVCQKFNIDIQIFRQSYLKLKNECAEDLRDQVLYDIDNSRKNNTSDVQARDMTREFTMEVFLYEQELRKQAFRALERTKIDLIKEEFTV